MNVGYRMSVQEYEELTPYAGDLVENWGKAPGHLNSDGQNLLVFGCKFGNVFIGVQPTFGYEVGTRRACLCAGRVDPLGLRGCIRCC